MDTAGLDSTTGGLPLKYVAVGAEEIGVGIWDTARNSHPPLILDNSTISTLGSPTLRVQPSLSSNPYTWMACPYPNPFPYPSSLQDVDLSAPLIIHTITAENTDFPYCVRLEITLELTELAAPDYYECEGCQWRCDSLYGDSACDAAGKPACVEPWCGAYTEETMGDHVQD